VSGRQEPSLTEASTRALPYLEHAVEGGEYLCGTFTLADAPYMALAMVLDVDHMPLVHFPCVASYLARLRTRPSYRSISPQTSLAESAGRE
jgi:glutathione S-transferase